MTRTFLIPAALGILAACGDATSPDAQSTPAAAAPVPTAQMTPAARPTETLTPLILTQSDASPRGLGGELGCAFTHSPGGDTLLIAAADVDDNGGGAARIRFDTDPISLTMEGTGGFSALADGATFSGPEGLQVIIARTGTEPLPEDPLIAMESPRYPAQMLLSRARQSLRVQGIWECGP